MSSAPPRHAHGGGGPSARSEGWEASLGILGPNGGGAAGRRADNVAMTQSSYSKTRETIAKLFVSTRQRKLYALPPMGAGQLPAARWPPIRSPHASSTAATREGRRARWLADRDGPGKKTEERGPGRGGAPDRGQKENPEPTARLKQSAKHRPGRSGRVRACRKDFQNNRF